jgi:hypothetical protein
MSRVQNLLVCDLVSEGDHAMSIVVSMFAVEALELCIFRSSTIIILHWHQVPPFTDNRDPLNMSFVSDDPSLWPLISFNLNYSYITGSWRT